MKGACLGWLVVGTLLVGCSGDSENPIDDEASVKRFVGFIQATYENAKPWPHDMISHAGNFVEFNRVGFVEGTSGKSTVAKLMGQAFLNELIEDLNDPDRRAIYAKGLMPADDMLKRVGDPAKFTWPATIVSLSVSQWDPLTAQLVEDPSKHTPLGGLVLLPVGSDPLIDPNPDLAKLVDTLQRLAKAYHGSLP